MLVTFSEAWMDRAASPTSSVERKKGREGGRKGIKYLTVRYRRQQTCLSGQIWHHLTTLCELCPLTSSARENTGRAGGGVQDRHGVGVTQLQSITLLNFVMACLNGKLHPLRKPSQQALCKTKIICNKTA